MNRKVLCSLIFLFIIVYIDCKKEKEIIPNDDFEDDFIEPKDSIDIRHRKESAYESLYSKNEHTEKKKKQSIYEKLYPKKISNDEMLKSTLEHPVSQEHDQDKPILVGTSMYFGTS